VAARSEPERMCVGCREPAAKRDLIRIARAADGIVADLSATMQGRGAYIHPRWECASRSLRHGALGKALRARPTSEEAARLEADIRTMLGVQ
jgi:predicted RNA-binding protein YlxR (DUF448 family)